MHASLIPHPDSPAPVESIVVDVARTASGLTLDYRVSGELGGLRLPAPAEPERTDELWRHSCFEAFLRPLSGEGYIELNFSPSTQWAAYRFSDYREGMESPDVSPPAIRVQTAADRLTLHASVDLAGLLPGDEAWQLGLAAVIEARDHAKSYWALAHPPGPADFHHRHCFALQLPPAKQR